MSTQDGARSSGLTLHRESVVGGQRIVCAVGPVLHMACTCFFKADRCSFHYATRSFLLSERAQKGSWKSNGLNISIGRKRREVQADRERPGQEQTPELPTATGPLPVTASFPADPGLRRRTHAADL